LSPFRYQLSFNQTEEEELKNYHQRLNRIYKDQYRVPQMLGVTSLVDSFQNLDKINNFKKLFTPSKISVSSISSEVLWKHLTHSSYNDLFPGNLFVSAWYPYDLTFENLNLLEKGSKEMSILPSSYFVTFSDSKKLVGLSITTTSKRVSGVCYDNVIYSHDYNIFVHHFIFHIERMLQIQRQNIENYNFGMRLWYPMEIKELV